MNQMLYEPCVCGSGKKMKFCCSDLAGDWEKIQRLLEADQKVGALEHLNRVIDQRTRQGKPDHPALLAERISLLRNLERDQWLDEVDRFLAVFPDNICAITWQGIKLLEMGMRANQGAADSSEEYLLAAIDRWVTVREATDKPAREWLALTVMLAQAMIDRDWIRPAMFILTVLTASGKPPEWVSRLYSSVQSDDSIPMVLRCFEDFGSWPEVRQSPPLTEAWSKLFDFDWRRAERELTELTGKNDAPATVWRLLAEARLLLGKTEEARAALRTYIEKWPSSADVFEAELILLSTGPKHDLGWIPLIKKRWKVLDIDRLQEAMISDPRCALVDESVFARFATEARPRIAAELFLAGPLPDDAELTSAEQTPTMLGHLLLFGKQTDRDAELLLLSFGERVESSAAVVQQIGGDLIAEISPNADDVGAAEHSWLNMHVAQVFRWPKGLSLQRRRELERAHCREVLLRRWPSRPVPCLDGRTFFEAAADPALRMRLLALIDLEERLLPTAQFAPLFAELRSEIGVLTPMEDGRSGSLRFLPVMSRYIDPDALSDNELIRAVVLADAYQDKPAFGHLAPAFLRRESLRGHQMTAFLCHSLIIQLDDRDEAAEWIEFGRGLSAESNDEVPQWVWSLLESRYYMRRGEITRSSELLLEQVRSNRIAPNEKEAFVQMAFSLGLVPPDLLARFGPQAQSATSEEPAGLWTPDSAAPAAGGGGKLWVPE